MSEISVVLGACDGERFLEEQLASIAAQSRLPDRLIFTDDHSTDSTPEIATAFAASAPFPVQIVRNPVNLGFVANFERGIGMAGDEGLIVLCDQDDVWHPDRLARLEAAFDRSPDAALVFSDAELVDAELRPLGRTLWDSIGFTPARQAAARDGRLFETLIRGSAVTGATMAFRGEYRSLVLPVGSRVGHDAWIALLLSAVAPAVAIPEILVRYRQHDRNQIGARRRGLVERLRRAREARLDGLADWHDHHARALERLEADTARPVAPRRLALLRESVAHLAVRSSLPRSRAWRVAPVARELLSGRYTRMSGGMRSAIRDLLA